MKKSSVFQTRLKLEAIMLFLRSSIMEALEKMAKAYGKTEIKYTLKEAENLAIKYGFKTSDFNPCDWCYALNLIHFMFGQYTANNPEQEVKLAFHWMHDKTLPEGKPFHHYHTMLKVEGEDKQPSPYFFL